MIQNALNDSQEATMTTDLRDDTTLTIEQLREIAITAAEQVATVFDHIADGDRRIRHAIGMAAQVGTGMEPSLILDAGSLARRAAAEVMASAREGNYRASEAALAAESAANVAYVAETHSLAGDADDLLDRARANAQSAVQHALGALAGLGSERDELERLLGTMIPATDR